MLRANRVQADQPDVTAVHDGLKRSGEIVATCHLWDVVGAAPMSEIEHGLLSLGSGPAVDGVGRAERKYAFDRHCHGNSIEHALRAKTRHASCRGDAFRHCALARLRRFNPPFCDLHRASD